MQRPRDARTPDETLEYIPESVGMGQVGYLTGPTDSPPGLWIKDVWHACPPPERPWGIAQFREQR